MASHILSIATSGTKTAREALNITAQNIANANTEGYVRRSAHITELAGSGRIGPLADQFGTSALSGAIVSGTIRHADGLKVADARRTASDAARAQAELATLANMEMALEQSALHERITGFEAALEQLAQNPTDPALRTQVLAEAEMMAESFNLAANNLSALDQALIEEAGDDVRQFNQAAEDLARINHQLNRAHPTGHEAASLLDSRDRLLEKMAGLANISAQFTDTGAAIVTMGGASAPVVDGAQVLPFQLDSATQGTLGVMLDGAPVTLISGTLAGHALARQELASTMASLDDLARDIITLGHNAQDAGVDLAGQTGQPLFAGSAAADITLALHGYEQLATAPAGASPNSKDSSNLDDLRAALAAADPAGTTNRLLYSVSSAVAGRQLTTEALSAIADASRNTLDRQSGVDLDREALNLVRYQQAFQASGRAIQVATDIFDTILAIR